MAPFALPHADLDLAAIDARVRATGLTLRGGFHPGADDAVPPLPDGTMPGTVLLIGNVGSSMWPAFDASGYRDGRADPLDDWSRAELEALAGELGAVALFPFEGPPFLPFLRWAERAEPVFGSPLGPLIHPEYGLWHAYRGALALRDRFVVPAKRVAQSPCTSCSGRPCLTRCPAQAVQEGRFDVRRCVQYLLVHRDGACMRGGCEARHACPVGVGYRYLPEQARHHMEVFVRNHHSRTDSEEGI